MYDLSDYGTQFQDTAGTVPITATTQALARVNDLSGLANNATQGTLGNRPLTTTIGTGFRGIEFDGPTSNRWMQTAAIDFSNSDEVTIVAGLRKSSDAARAVLAELGTGGTNRFTIEAPNGPAPTYAFAAGGSAIVGNGTSGFAAPDTAIISGQAKISTDTNILRRNGTATVAATDQGTGNMSNAVFYVGRRAGTSLPFSGVLTFLFVINRLLTAQELANVEAFANARTGAY
jgi:hypothetical protein